jgi:uncharacterized membrane protein YiaA
VLLLSVGLLMVGAWFVPAGWDEKIIYVAAWFVCLYGPAAAGRTERWIPRMVGALNVTKRRRSKR